MSGGERIGELFTIAKGRRAPETFAEPAPGRERYIQIEDLRSGDDLKYARDSNGTRVVPSDICIAWDGANAGTVGYGLEGLIGSTIARLRPIDKRRVFTPYLARYLQRNFAVLNKATTGATIPHVNRDQLLGLTPRLPSLDEQRRVSCILDKADAIRRKQNWLVAQAEEFLRSIFLDLFGDPVANSHGLEEKPIGELAVVTTGNTPSRQVPAYYGDYIEWIKSDNLNTPHHYLTKASESLSQTGLRVGRSVPAGSTLITCIAGSPSCIGNAALADRNVAFNQQINALTPKSDIEPEFIYATTLFSKARIQAASTSGMKGMVSKGALEQVRFILPLKAPREKFVSIFRKVMALTTKLETAACEAETLYGSLAQRAFFAQT